MYLTISSPLLVAAMRVLPKLVNVSQTAILVPKLILIKLVLNEISSLCLGGMLNVYCSQSKHDMTEQRLLYLLEHLNSLVVFN